MKILILLRYRNYWEKKIQRLLESHPGAELYTDIKEAPIEEVQILLGERIPSEVLLRASSLKLLLVPFSGVNHLPLELLKGRGVRVANTHGNCSHVAERAVGMLLALLGRILYYHNELRQERWHGFWGDGELEDCWTSLQGRTVGILGTGSVGAACAGLLLPFGCRLLGLRRTPGKQLAPFDRITTEIDEIIAESSIIILTLPLTRETRCIINAERLSSMKVKFLVNVARGPVVDEQALYRALSENWLAGAALDVWYTYPKGGTVGAPARFPIHTLKNVVLSPHMGGFTEHALRGDIDNSFSNLNEYLTTGNLANEVLLDRGY